MGADRPTGVSAVEANPPRSCNNCHRRKVRCDKGQPCLRCSRAGKPCNYPPTGQRIPRPRRTPIGRVAFRLQPLQALDAEKHVTAPPPSSLAPDDGSSLSASHAGRPITGSAAAAAPGETEQFFGDEIIVQNGSQSEYFNEPLHSRMIEDQKDIQSVLVTPPSSGQNTPHVPMYNPMGILSAASPSQPSHSFFPSKQTALRLWNTYLERIEACSGIKVLHIPTDEIRICAAIEHPESASPEDRALCFAVFFAAMAVLPPAEAPALVQLEPHDPPIVQSRCKTGFEEALAEAEILDKPTLPLLCALTLYLSSLQLHSRGKGIWVLNGVAIRLAQAMGLHRDGERLGLSPFQSELRRRVWWHITCRDARAAEDFGLQRFCTRRSDARLPLNLDDGDLRLDMAALPAPREGVFTAMTLPLVTFEVARAMRRLGAIAAAAGPDSPPDESVRAQVILETRMRVEELLRGCNPVVPRQRLALLASRLALRKADFVSRQQWLALSHHHNCRRSRKFDPDSARTGIGGANPDNCNNDLTHALETLSLALQIASDEMLRPYAWLWRTNPECHVVMYLLWHLCVHPSGDPNVQRTLDLVDRWFAEHDDVVGGGGLGHRGAILAALRRKAEAVHGIASVLGVGGKAGVDGRREGRGGGEGEDVEVRGQGMNNSAVTDTCMDRQEQLGEVREGDASWEWLRRQSAGGESWWTGELDQVPDWGSLVEAFQLDGQEFSSMSWF